MHDEADAALQGWGCCALGILCMYLKDEEGGGLYNPDDVRVAHGAGI